MNLFLSPLQYRAIICLLLLLLAGMAAQMWETRARLDRLEKSVTSAEVASIDALEAVKIATGHPSLEMENQTGRR